MRRHTEWAPSDGCGCFRGLGWPTLGAALLVFLGWSNAGLAQDFELVGLHPGASAQPTAIGKKLWTGFEYEGMIYWGYGDYNNNTGPVDIMPFDPATRQFSASEFAAPTEAIYVFRALGNGNLYAPYTDTRGSEGYARKDAAGWVSARPLTTHSFDMSGFNGSVFLVGSLNYDAVVWISTDGEGSFQESLHLAPAVAYDPATEYVFSRFYFCGELNGGLYVQGFDHVLDLSTMVWKADFVHPTSKVFDGTSWTDAPSLRMNLARGYHSNTLAGKLVYQSHERFQNPAPVKLYAFDGATAWVALPDILCYTVTESEFFAVYRPAGSTDFIVARSADLSDWTPVAVVNQDVGDKVMSVCIADGRVFLGTSDAQVYRSVFKIPPRLYAVRSSDDVVLTWTDLAQGVYVTLRSEVPDLQSPLEIFRGPETGMTDFGAVTVIPPLYYRVD